MKLKGLFSKKLKAKDRKKKERTLRRMQKTRQIDSDNLRVLIEQKMKWALAEKNKGLKLVKQTEIQIERLNGILLFINDLLQPKENINK